MSARGLSCIRWRMMFWQRLADRLPPRREWPAMFAAIALAIVLAVEVLRPDLVWRVFV